jgi:hypothetical protein
MQHLFRLSQRSKPQVSTEQYAALLRATWEASQIDPSVHGFPSRLYRPSDSEDPYVFRLEYLEYAQRNANAFDQLNARRMDLEAVRPDSRLSRVHEEAVKSFRGALELHNAIAKRDIVMLEGGNYAAAQKADSEVRHWQLVCQRVNKKLAAALRQVQLNQPTLFASLDLPPDWLDSLPDELDETD